MNKKTKFIFTVILVALLLLTACTQDADQNESPVISEPGSSGIEITSQEEADGIDQAIAELEETDAQ